MLRQDRLFQQELQKRYELINAKEVIEYYNRGFYDLEIDIIDYETGMEKFLDMRIDEEEFMNIINNAIRNKSYFGKLRR